MSKKQRVVLSRLNWDVEYYHDIMSGIGFEISEPAEVDTGEGKIKSLYGSQSPLYGTTYSDEQAFIERYRCKCGKFASRQFEGEECPFCHTKVEYRDSNINITGWINLGSNRIINPYYYHLFTKVLGGNSHGKVFDDIINTRYKITKNGLKEKPKDEEYDYVPLSPYSGIGIDSFYDNYDNILRYFQSIKKNKVDTLEILLHEKDSVFTSHIPIYSTLLRPQSMTSDTFYFGSIDKHINTIFRLSENIKDCIDTERDYILWRIQRRANCMWDLCFDMLTGKEGFIRDQLLGGSLNYTSRNVIIPDPTLRDDEVDVCYHTFLELYKFQIINYIMRLDDIPLSKAYSIWRNAYKFDEKVYQIMMYIVNHDHPKLLINRNPTLNYYSMLRMKIRNIKDDPSNYCLSVPLSILPGLNADFDGDILNIIGIMDKSLEHMFRKFDPIRRMIVDRDSGFLNSYFTINKGQLIDLYHFCTIGATENDQPETFPEGDK
jgi:hypothetical protein